MDLENSKKFKNFNAVSISDQLKENSKNFRKQQQNCVRNNLRESVSVGTTRSFYSTGTDICFEPDEITGRSTLYHKDFNNKNLSISEVSARLSVSEILATSFAPKARNLCESLRHGNNTIVDLTVDSEDSDVGIASKVDDVNGEGIKKGNCDASRNLQSVSDFSFPKISFQDGCTSFDSDKFTPAELMKSKLLLEEISWAQKYADIPAAVLSDNAKAMASNLAIMKSNNLNMSTQSVISDPNISMSKFFNNRCENISNILISKSPEKSPPVRLIDDTMSATNSEIITSDLDTSLTPKIDHKLYSKIDKSIGAQLSTNNQIKDSFSNSYMLSISAIDRALANLNIQTEDSGTSVVNQILEKSGNCKSHNCNASVSNGCNNFEDFDVEAVRYTSKAHFNLENSLKSNINCINELISENKENLDPTKSREAQISDTLSFTESVLHSMTMKDLQRNESNQNRSPLSPINNLNPAIVVTGCGHDADIDEPKPVFISPPRRVVRKKSPESMKNHKDIKEDKLYKTFENATAKKSLSYEVLGSLSCQAVKPSQQHLNFNAKRNNVISPKTNINYNSSPRSDSPGSISCTPVSSPRSCQSPSSTVGYRSPQLDSTTFSEQQYLNTCAVGKSASSPLLGKTGDKIHRSESVRPYSSNLIGSPVARSISRCSSSSEYVHFEGTPVPLKVTNMQISWCSTKLRTEVRKSMQMKNISDKRLLLRIEVEGPGFQLTHSQNNIQTIQPQECRSFDISFCPTVTGVAVGVLSFYVHKNRTDNNVPFLNIPLYGYGGHANIIPQNVLKGPVGSEFLPMGDVNDLAEPLERIINIHNKGALLGFAIICITSIGLCISRLCDAFKVIPNVILIPPGGVVNVRIIFQPRREDIKNIMKKLTNVITLANMRIISGDEATRQRIRQLINVMTLEERSKVLTAPMDKLWEKFPSETQIPQMRQLKDDKDMAINLVTRFRVDDITLTLNYESLNDTIGMSSMYMSDPNETILFHSICAPIATANQKSELDTVDELLEKTITTNDTEISSHNEPDLRSESASELRLWSVTPNCITFDYSLHHANFYIRHAFKSRQQFKIICSRDDLMICTPCKGYIEPDEDDVEFRIIFSARRSAKNSLDDQITITVYIENEYFVLPIKYSHPITV